MYYFTGYIKIVFRSPCCELILNRLRSFIPFYKIKKYESDSFVIYAKYCYKKKVIAVFDECGAEIISVKSAGILPLIDKYKKRVGIWTGALLSCVLLLVLSGLIWEIRISGNTTVPDSDIIYLLKQYGVSEGSFIDKSILENVYNSFLVSEPRISWLSVNFDGTVAKVEVKETEFAPEELNRNRNVNVIAECDGVIRRVDVFDGKGEVNAGEVVTKGDLLISSFPESRKTGIYMRAARGNVWASTVHKYKITIKKSQKVKVVETKRKAYNTIIILGKRMPLYIQYSGDSANTEKQIECSRCNLWKYFQLPFRIETKSATDYKTFIVLTDVEKAEKMAETELQHRIKNDLQNVEIIKKTHTLTENETEYTFFYDLECYENIALIQEFDFQ